MNSKQLYQLLRIKKNNSGFTLFELLIGLIMSIFVTGALGFGLYQILRTTSTESSKISARNEATRAIEFISDEIRRARSIESNANNARDNGGGAFDTTGKTVVLALDIPEINDGDTLDTDNDDTTSERIVYYLESSSGTNWQGPQVLYRWGPPLNANGEYTQNGWQEEALIDGIDDTAITTNPCDAGDSLNPPLANNPAGFYACISGTNNAAQIFLTGGIDTTTGDDTNYTADTKAVARAKDVTVDSEEEAEDTPTNFKTLKVDYTCSYQVLETASTRVSNIQNNPWTVQFTFNSGANTTTWTHEPNRQAQPIDVSANNNLEIEIAPINGSNCISSSDSRNYTIKLTDSGGSEPNYWQSFNGNNDGGTYNDPDVKGDGTVLVLKKDSLLEGDLNRSGYNYAGDANSLGIQTSLGQFLVDQGYAEYLNGSDGTGGYRIIGLGNDQRIFAFEIGHTDQSEPGFDVQDAILIVTNDKFENTYTSSP